MRRFDRACEQDLTHRDIGTRRVVGSVEHCREPLDARREPESGSSHPRDFEDVRDPDSIAGLYGCVVVGVEVNDRVGLADPFQHRETAQA